MRPRTVASVVVIVIAIAVSAAIAPKPLGPAPVVVELFTSQGCSSCPPADALLSQLHNRRGVIPLGFHVDYWDHLGWRDAFSSRQWTQRQMMYVHSMHLESAYTPQAVVNGTRQLVGSNEPALETAIEESSRRSVVGHVSLQASRNGNVITANVQADAPPAYDLVLAIFQDGVTTSIGGGENSGRTQTENAIVRKIERVSTGTTTIPIDPRWKDVGVAVFLQNRETLAIANAAVTRLLP